MSHPESPRSDAPGRPAVRHVIRAFLDRGPERAFLVGLVIVGILVFLPAIRSPLLFDDYIHRSMANGTFPAPRGPFDFYDFVNGHDRALLLERGIVPWWTDPSLEIRFFRPLSSLLLYGDHRTFASAPLVLHVHSFLWWVLAVLGVRALFVRYFSPRVALFATAAFALAPCHVLPLAWLANREALVSLALGLVALVRYEDFRDTKKPKDAVLATLLFALAFLAGEYALLLGGYVVAFELFRAKGPATSLGRRVVGLLPFVVPLVAYLVVRRALGYGTTASGFYSDPTRDPLGFLSAAPKRLSWLVLGAWLALDGEAMRPSYSAVALVLAAVALLVFVRPAVLAAIRALDDLPKRRAMALGLGSLLSLVPVLSVQPSPRLLEAALVGVAAIVALVVDHAFFTERTAGPFPMGERAAQVALLFLFAHFVEAPIVSRTHARTVQRVGMRFAYYAGKFSERLGDPEKARVIVLRDSGSAFYLPFALGPTGAPPRSWRVLAHTGHVLTLRDGDTSFSLNVGKDSTVFPLGHGNLFRKDEARLPVGSVVTIPGLTAHVLEANASGPTAVRFVFDGPLDDAVFVSETQKGFRIETLPDPGFGAPFDP
jgi:hypothetical protein